MAADGGIILGHYELIELLGRGSSGEVWRARPRDHAGDEVAIKRVHPGAGQAERVALSREAAWLYRFSGRGVVELLGVVSDRGAPAMVMQLATGGSLAHRIGSTDPMASWEVARMAASVAQTLATFHTEGLVHGDIKPSNVLFDASGKAVVGDLGSCRPIGVRRGRRTPGLRSFTPAFVPPTPTTDPQADVYALAVSCQRALERCRSGVSADPFGQTVIDAIDGIVADPGAAPDAGTLAQRLQVLMASVARQPTPPTGEAAVDLRDPAELASGAPVLIDDEPTQDFDRNPHPPPPPSNDSGNGPKWGALGVAGLILLVSTLVVSQWQARQAAAGAPRPATVPRCPGTAGDPLPNPGKSAVALVEFAADKCRREVSWNGQELSVRNRTHPGTVDRYRFDRPGQLLFGNWSCRGPGQPALYWAKGGRLLVFATLADRAPSRVVPEPANGTARVEHGQDGCDTVHVVPGKRG